MGCRVTKSFEVTNHYLSSSAILGTCNIILNWVIKKLDSLNQGLVSAFRMDLILYRDVSGTCSQDNIFASLTTTVFLWKVWTSYLSSLLPTYYIIYWHLFPKLHSSCYMEDLRRLSVYPCPQQDCKEQTYLYLIILFGDLSVFTYFTW